MRYITALYQIVAVGQNTNSYKFALWRALARLAPAKSMISKLDLAPLFLDYYWPCSSSIMSVKALVVESLDMNREVSRAPLRKVP